MKTLALFLFILSPLKGESYGITYEVFSMTLGDAAKLRRAKMGGKEMYQKVVSRLAEETIRQEAFLNLKTETGSRATVEEIQERIFPTEYEHPGGNSLSHPIPPPDWRPPLIPLRWVASAYDTKNLGDTLEVSLENHARGMLLSLAPTRVTFLSLDHYGEGVAKIAMPRFGIQKVKTSLVVSLGMPALVGTISPPRELEDRGEKRVWLAFVTVLKG